jgi:8-oxo-dGTP diphosphatase
MFLLSNDVVLIKKNRPNWQKGKLNGVGGLVRENENVKQAMIREFKEETAIEHELWDRFAIGTSNDETERVHFYRTLSHKYDFVVTKEEEQVFIIPFDQLNDFPLIYNLKWLIELALVLIHWKLNFIIYLIKLTRHTNLT